MAEPEPETKPDLAAVLDPICGREIMPEMLEHDIRLLERARSVFLERPYWSVGGVSYADMASAIERRIAELTERLGQEEDQKKGNQPSQLSDEDCEQLLLALAVARGDKGITKHEERILNWAAGAITDYTCLGLVLSGKAVIDIDDKGEIVFRANRKGEHDGR